MDTTEKIKIIHALMDKKSPVSQLRKIIRESTAPNEIVAGILEIMVSGPRRFLGSTCADLEFLKFPTGVQKQLDNTMRWMEWVSDEEALKIIKLCIRHNADINQVWHQQTLLHCAVLESSVSVVAFLLERGAFLEPSSKTTELPPYSALGSAFNLVLKYPHKLELLEILLQHGSNINSQSMFKEPLWFSALGHNNLDLAQTLIERGADIHLKDNENNNALQYFITHALELNPETIAWIIGHGVSPYHRNKNGLDVFDMVREYIAPRMSHTVSELVSTAWAEREACLISQQTNPSLSARVKPRL